LKSQDWQLRAFCAFVFAIAVAQDPLYTANQNTKYLHGAAAAGYGDLARDWMANTIDPLPVFTSLVRALFALGLPELSYAIFAVLAACYAWWLASLMTGAGLVRDTRAGVLPFMSGVALTQAIFAKWPRGLADQYLLDHYLQPCVFGVLLIAGVATYVRDRPIVAVVLVVLAAWIHPDYLPTTIICIVVFASVSPRRPGFDRARCWRVLALAAVLLAPLLLHVRWLLQPTTPETWQRSLDVLVQYRIPHHTDAREWFDIHEALHLVAMALGTWLVRARGLRHVMVALLVLVVGSLLATLLFGLEAVEAITPWRASVLLMPLALAAIVARGLDSAERRWPGRERIVGRIAWSVLGLAVVVGVVRQVERVRDYAGAAPMPTMLWIRDHRPPGAMYVVPTRDVDFDRFRLVTGASIVINWKTHPYRDVELLEWETRLESVERFYDAASAPAACAELHGLAAGYHVSHAVVATRHPLDPGHCPGVSEVHRDEAFRVIRIGASAP
jgi:hypothetical protein